MATWLGHLRVAEKLLPHFPELDPGQFVYGSLAPDFGKPLENGSFYPTKDVSHFMTEVDDKSLFLDLSFYKNYLLEAARQDIPRYSFLLGYFFHLTMDGLWSRWIGKACKRDYADMIEKMGEQAWWTMKDDWYGIDVQFARENRGGLFWTQVMALKDLPLYLDFQENNAVRDQVERIQKLYSDPPLELVERAAFPYLSKTTMQKYVDESTDFLLEYYQLITQDGIPDGCETFLDLFPTERFLPYPPPLGD
jgi:hypothetical protein